MTKPTMNDLKPRAKQVPKPPAKVELKQNSELVAPPPLKAIPDTTAKEENKSITRVLIVVFMLVALATILVLGWIMYTNIKAS